MEPKVSIIININARFTQGLKRQIMNNPTYIAGAGNPCHLLKKGAFGPERAWVHPGLRSLRLGACDGGLSPAQASCANEGRARVTGAGESATSLHHKIDALNAAFYPRLYTNIPTYFTTSIITTAAPPLPLLPMKVGVGDPE